jgi:hypothetical protein
VGENISKTGKQPRKPKLKEFNLGYESLKSEPKRHVRRKICVTCGNKWEIIWHDGESFVENIQCPICRKLDSKAKL